MLRWNILYCAPSLSSCTISSGEVSETEVGKAKRASHILIYKKKTMHSRFSSPSTPEAGVNDGKREEMSFSAVDQENFTL